MRKYMVQKEGDIVWMCLKPNHHIPIRQHTHLVHKTIDSYGNRVAYIRALSTVRDDHPWY
jgi:hypothetical protein